MPYLSLSNVGPLEARLSNAWGRSKHAYLTLGYLSTYRRAMNAPPDDAGAAAGAADSTAADGSLRKRPRSSNGYPRGVSKTTSGKFQGRTNYKPPGEKRGIQRNVGTFDAAEEAGQAVADAEAKLKAGSEVWTEPSRKNEHKRGEVIAPLLIRSLRSAHHTLPTAHYHAQAPPPQRSTARRKGVYSTMKSAQNNLSSLDFAEWVAKHKRECDGEDTTKLKTVPLPTRVEDINYPPMAEFFAQREDQI